VGCGKNRNGGKAAASNLPFAPLSLALTANHASTCLHLNEQPPQKQNLKEPKEPGYNRCNTDTCSAVIAYRVAAAAPRA
jgi:hypothetical protein